MAIFLNLTNSLTLDINYNPKYFCLYLCNNLLYCLVNLFNFRSTNNNFILNNIFIILIPFILFALAVQALLSFMEKKVTKEARKGSLIFFLIRKNQRIFVYF